MRYLFIGYQSGNGLKTLHIVIKTNELAKKQTTMFQRKIADFKGKQPEIYKY